MAASPAGSVEPEMSKGCMGNLHLGGTSPVSIQAQRHDNMSSVSISDQSLRSFSLRRQSTTSVLSMLFAINKAELQHPAVLDRTIRVAMTAICFGLSWPP